MVLRMNNHQQIPTWLLLANTTNCVKPQPRLRFVRKMMGHLAQIFSDELYSSYQAKQSGLLQRIDPRTKVLVLLSTVLVINLSSSYLVYLFLITISYLYARLSNISPQLVFRRAWLVIPPLLLLSSIPAMCNIVVPGHSWLVLLQPSTKYNWLNHGLYLTDNGVGAVSRLVIRCGLSLSFTYLFVTTSCWSDFTLALETKNSWYCNKYFGYDISLHVFTG